MPIDPTAHLTTMLQEAHRGDPMAVEAAFRAVEEELKLIVRAKRYFRNRFEPTTAISDSAFLAYLEARDLNIENRAHFFSYVGTVIFRLLAGQQRFAGTNKRGGEFEHVAFELCRSIGAVPDYETAVLLSNAFDRLEASNPETAEIFVRYFVFGDTMAEISEATGIPEITVKRRIQYCRAYFRKVMRSPKPDEE